MRRTKKWYDSTVVEIGCGLLTVAGIIAIYWMLAETPIHQYRFPH